MILLYVGITDDSLTSEVVEDGRRLERDTGPEIVLRLELLARYPDSVGLGLEPSIREGVIRGNP